jgi:hypothetical protein
MRCVAVAAIVLVAYTAAAAPEQDDYYARLASAVRARLDALVAARAPKLVPPVPITPAWKVVKLGSFELGAPLVALTAAELDGDRRSGELYAVTPREVIAIGFKNGKLVELGRVAFAGERATPEPRDVVGTAVVDGNEVVVAASPWAKGMRVKWAGKSLVMQPDGPGFLVCPNVRVQLQPGRNHFNNGTFDTRCRTDLVDKDGYPMHVRADLATSGKLAVVVERCRAGAACEVTGKFELARIGTAFAIADVDRDGTAEIIVSEASAPGDPDSAKVISLGGDERKPMFKKTFAGGVAGLVVVDGDDADDVAEVVAAVRFPGATRVDLWRLD